MSANGSQEKLELLMRVATSRLDIVNEADTFSRKVQEQVGHFQQLKKRAMSIPVIGSVLGTVGGILLIKTLTGRKNHAAAAHPRSAGTLFNSSIFRFIIEILITLAFPSLKKMGLDLANKKFLGLFKFRGQ